jgi:hypothetical protein
MLFRNSLESSLHHVRTRNTSDPYHSRCYTVHSWSNACQLPGRDQRKPNFTHQNHPLYGGFRDATYTPFILVRLLYSAITAFGHDSSFNVVTGSVTITLVMVALEEIAVVAIYTITGLSLK